MKLEDSIQAVRGIGEKRALIYRKAGIETVGDLLSYFPRTYEVFDEPVTIREAVNMDFAAVRVVLLSVPKVIYTGKMPVTSVTVRDEEGQLIKAVWYRMPYLKNALRQDVPCVLRGRIKDKRNGRPAEKIFEQPHN